MLFFDEIKKIRPNKFMSQSDFAHVLGVSFTTVNRWETEKSKQSYKAMKTIDSYCKKNGIDFDVSKELVDED